MRPGRKEERGRRRSSAPGPRALVFLLSSLLCLLPFCSAGALVASPVLETFQQDLNGAVASIRPSVVSVRAEKRMDAGQGGGSLLYESIGSGFVVDERGYVVTNDHVVEGSGNIRVSLWRSTGDREFVARIVDADPSLDLALLKIESNDRFVPAALGNSDQIKMGDWLLSVGSPFGFAHTVTLGIVSDRHRDLVINGMAYKGMIQTDAVINQGNSGGPLVDISGRVVAVGTAIYAPNGTSTGVAFAIPINRARHFFTLTTGAMTVAAAAPAPANAPPAGAREPININDRMPGDATHKKFADCTQCHIISRKSMVNLQKTMPHPMVGSCDKCHTVINEPVAHGPTPVAAVVPRTDVVDPGNAGTCSFSSVLVTGGLLSLLIAGGFTWFAARRNEGGSLVGQSSLLRFLFTFVISMAGLCTVIGALFG